MHRVAICLALLAACASAINVCFPDVYTVDEVGHDPKKDDVFGARNHFSWPLKKHRIDVDFVAHDNQPLKERLIFYFDGTTKAFYEAIISPSGSNCTKHALSSFEKPCLSKNAHHRGTIVLGATLTCDNYIESFVDHQGEHIRADILAVNNINVPVRATFRDKNDFHVIEYWNFKEKVNHDAFNLPAVCKKAATTPVSEETLARVNQHKLASLHKF